MVCAEWPATHALAAAPGLYKYRAARALTWGVPRVLDQVPATRALAADFPTVAPDNQPPRTRATPATRAKVYFKDAPILARYSAAFSRICG